MKKGNKFFNVIVTIAIITLICVVGYAAYYYVNRFIAFKQSEKMVEEFENNIVVVAIDDENQSKEGQENTENDTIVETQSTPSHSTKRTPSNSSKSYKVIGTIKIPKTNVKAAIVDRETVSSMTSAVAVLYGVGLNKQGNTVLAAHNYRNGTLFSNNKKLMVGDKIYITDQMGTTIEYSIYKSYITSDTDFEYAVRNTGGKREISLTTCTTDASKRLVIWARET